MCRPAVVVGALDAFPIATLEHDRQSSQLVTVACHACLRGIARLCKYKPRDRARRCWHRDPRHLDDRMAPDIELVVADAVARAGPDSAIRTYHTLRARYPAIAFEEQQLNHLGYGLLQGGKVDAAIVIFRLNADAFPKSANVYDSLGEAYMDHGDRTLAIRNYERSLALNPANDNATKMLAKLKSQTP
jgi:tetratricopeptide (TPR) repeat protein